eukprot:8209627-Pyramimonas_sp.AAC.1
MDGRLPAGGPAGCRGPDPAGAEPRSKWGPREAGLRVRKICPSPRPRPRPFGYRASFVADAPRGTYPCDRASTGSRPGIQTARAWIR